MAEITEEPITKIALATAKVIKSHTLYPVNEHLFDDSPADTSKNLDLDLGDNRYESMSQKLFILPQLFLDVERKTWNLFFGSFRSLKRGV